MISTLQQISEDEDKEQPIAYEELQELDDGEQFVVTAAVVVEENWIDNFLDCFEDGGKQVVDAISLHSHSPINIESEPKQQTFE